MKLNLTIKATKNYQTVEISATDIEVAKYTDTKNWLIKEAQNAIEQFVPGDNYTQRQSQQVSRPRERMASEKQINYLKRLFPNQNIDYSNMTAREASSLIDQYKKPN